MNRYRGLLMIVVLVFASLACQALTGGGEPESSSIELPFSDGGNADDEDESESNNTSSNSDFPMTVDAYNILDVGDGSVLFYTKMSLDDVMAFYRAEYTSRGYAENELLTVVSDGVFSLVFDGGSDDRAVVIQSVDLGDGSRTITIRLEAQ
ncbi:MAG TPA: hypothetical protein VLA72_13330 [Anaerolineales bacterium]|nr:hypothetical protein [Anaerolineales bacterium]